MFFFLLCFIDKTIVCFIKTIISRLVDVENSQLVAALVSCKAGSVPAGPQMHGPNQWTQMAPPLHWYAI